MCSKTLKSQCQRQRRQQQQQAQHLQQAQQRLQRRRRAQQFPSFAAAYPNTAIAPGINTLNLLYCCNWRLCIVKQNYRVDVIRTILALCNYTSMKKALLLGVSCHVTSFNQ